MSKSAPRNSGIRKRSLRARLKKNLLADLLAIDIVQEIEILLGRQAVADLDFEALEVAVRQQVLQLALSVYQHVETDQFRSPLNEIATELLPDVTKLAASRA